METTAKVLGRHIVYPYRQMQSAKQLREAKVFVSFFCKYRMTQILFSKCGSISILLLEFMSITTLIQNGYPMAKCHAKPSFSGLRLK